MRDYVCIVWDPTGAAMIHRVIDPVDHLAVMRRNYQGPLTMQTIKTNDSTALQRQLCERYDARRTAPGSRVFILTPEDITELRAVCIINYKTVGEQEPELDSRQKEFIKLMLQALRSPEPAPIPEKPKPPRKSRRTAKP